MNATRLYLVTVAMAIISSTAAFAVETAGAGLAQQPQGSSAEVRCEALAALALR